MKYTIKQTNIKELQDVSQKTQKPRTSPIKTSKGKRVYELCFLLFIIGVSITFLSSCKKLIEVDPPINEIVGQEIYNSNATAASVLTGIYTKMGNSGVFTGLASVSVKAGLSADELISVADPSNILNILYTNSLTNESDLFWTDLYDYIFRTNSAIEGISASAGISDDVKMQLIGEAKFLRAFMYFYLVNLYGDVPLLISTDIKNSATAARTNKDNVYGQIIRDLLEAQSNLKDDYVGPDASTKYVDRTRPNKAVATALLARVYLYVKKYEEAETEATKLINNTSIYQLESLDNTFLKTSKEAIWQLEPVQTLYNTLDAPVFVLAAGPNNSPAPGPDGISRPVYLSNQISDAFEVNDQRISHWTNNVTVNGVTYPFTTKYKVWLPGEPKREYLMVLRLAEQYLIRAEARAYQNKLAGSNSAKEDINLIRNRAGLGPNEATDKVGVINAIIQERKVELFTEWGHRWLDLKRTGTIDQVMTAVAPAKGPTVTWVPYKALYPIPVSDIQRNPSLRGYQNPGYPEQ